MGLQPTAESAYIERTTLAMLRRYETETLLNHLCVKLGFCIPPSEAAKLVAAPPDSPTRFCDAVFLAEGLGPNTADRSLYRQVLAMVRAAYDAAEHASFTRDDSSTSTAVQVRVVPLDELASWPVDRIADVVFPHESARAAAPGDPSRHELGAAIELLQLATAALASRYGAPDFPTSEEPIPDWLSREGIAAVAWDFDTYQILLELCGIEGGRRPLYLVRYRKREN